MQCFTFTLIVSWAQECRLWKSQAWDYKCWRQTVAIQSMLPVFASGSCANSSYKLDVTCLISQSDFITRNNKLDEVHFIFLKSNR